MTSKSRFRLHDRLAADSLPVGALEVCELRLMNNRLWPWMLLVPQLDDITELHQLPPATASVVMAEISRVSAAVAYLFPVHKINVGMLGNIVTQLHIHVIGRRIGDPAWPNPVWGANLSEPYPAQDAGTIVGRLRDHFGYGG